MGCFHVRRKPSHSTSIRPFPGRAVPSRPRGDDGRPRADVPSRDSSMPNKMLIDATHPEETRVVVLRGNRVEEFDFESANRKQLRGNIYLAKVTRVEPSLQAAFVDYGGNRHGFLAFGEIHPDYYQIPIADRQRLLEIQAEQARLEDEEEDLELALSQTAAADAEPGHQDALNTGPDDAKPSDAEPADPEYWAHP